MYAKSIKNHVVEIKSVTDQMMALDKKARLEIDSSDEIGQLKAQINDLYETLLDSISNLEFKNKEILRLEKIKLKSENPNYSDMDINEDTDFELWGVATWNLHKLRK